ncbi:hypothetical protein B0H10DRAFT_2167366 [Mycena sp. CBHHK59/15]|nr:hypothetical protein B0H10DRAFT_2167366 [Mycena sp. CBHHK59/15]
MLPRPVSTDRRHGFTTRYTSSSALKSLLNRSRATNLAVLGLVFFTAVSFLLNVKLYYFSFLDPKPSSAPFPLNILAPVTNIHSNLKHLIIVPGHGIWKGTNPDLRLKTDEWTFESYGTSKESSRLEVFFQHISNAARLALEDQRSLVVFSGGQTQPTSTTTEGESYLRLALSANLFQSDTFNRATSESYALDSFQNLLFSIARFREYTGSYPEQITVVGYEMKRARFMDLHRAAIRWPENRFNYIGIDANEDNSQARQGERQNGYLPYLEDIYGCHGFLANKRRQRNHHARFPPYYSSCPEMGPLLGWCPEVYTQLFSGDVPWSTS